MELDQLFLAVCSFVDTDMYHHALWLFYIWNPQEQQVEISYHYHQNWLWNLPRVLTLENVSSREQGECVCGMLSSLLALKVDILMHDTHTHLTNCIVPLIFWVFLMAELRCNLQVTWNFWRRGLFYMKGEKYNSHLLRRMWQRKVFTQAYVTLSCTLKQLLALI